MYIIVTRIEIDGTNYPVGSEQKLDKVDHELIASLLKRQVIKRKPKPTQPTDSEKRG